MNRKISIVFLMLLLSGCAHKLDESDFAADTAAAQDMTAEVTDIAAETGEPEPVLADTADVVTENTNTENADTENTDTENTGTGMHSSENTAAVFSDETLTAEDFLYLFDNADISTCRLGSNMKEVLKLVHEGIHIKRLNTRNIAAAFSEGCAESTLFAFSVSGSSGILPLRAGSEEYYAVNFSTEDDENFIAVFGNRDLAAPDEAMKYVNTCGRADYLAFCTKAGNNYYLVPVAAGTSRDGIYAVLPNLAVMGYDISASEPFAGITQNYGIYVSGTDYNSESEILTIEYETINTFPTEIYFQCEEIFIGGKEIPEEYKNDFPIILYDKGQAELSVPEPADGEIFYFRGSIYDAVTDDELYEAGIAAYNINQ